MGAVTSSLQQSTNWIRTQGSNTRNQQRGSNRQRRARRTEGAQEDIEARGEEFYSSDDEDYGSTDDYVDADNGNEGNRTLGRNIDDDDSLLEGEETSSVLGQAANDSHPLYFGPSFHPVVEQSPAQLQLQRQIEQQLEHQQRQEFWQQQHRQQQQQQQQQQNQQLSPLSNVGGQQLSLNDFILPSAISGLNGISAGGNYPNGTAPGSPVMPSPTIIPTTDNLQDQLYRNSNLYNLISGLNVNALLTEVQRAGTLDLSVLEQELDDVEGGWMDIDDEDDQNTGNQDDDTDIDYGQDGTVREMQPTKRSPTALACNINLKKSTLRLVKNSTVSKDSSIPASSHLRPNYRLDFSFDSLTPCDIKLFWVVKEVEEDGELGFRLRRLHHLPQPTTYHFPAGLNQRFISPILPLYTMSLPELTMQGLPSTSMRMFQKKNQKLWKQLSTLDKGAEDNDRDLDGEGDNTSGRSHKNNKKKKNKSGKNGGSGGGQEPPFGTDYYKKLATSVRSLPTPVADSPGLYLVENQAISTFACFNISSEGGFEIKVMKQKVWINSTNYLIQEIYGFTDSVSSSAPSNNINNAPTKTPLTPQNGKSPRASISQDRRMSRLSRAESIASRVNELTMDHVDKKKVPNTSGGTRDVAMDGDEEGRASQKENDSESRTVTDLNISEPGADEDQVQNGTRDESSKLSDEAGDKANQQEEPNLVLLDAPECVICLSDVKDTIVLPFFQALLHIASTPTRVPNFAAASASLPDVAPINESNDNNGSFSVRF
ncbi:hypothetical protein BGZ76_004430 [Entomortierella beljakovae]|nr:hypothetical protein BGZ76_004430 [Entomortierella beljakovae]